MVTRTLLGIARRSLLGLWIALELNILRFIVFSQSRENNNNYSSRKYFIVQRLGSFLLLIRVVRLSLLRPNTIYFVPLASGLILKAGLPPFHWWIIRIMAQVRIDVLFVLRTWQKLLVFYPIIKFNNWYITTIVLATRVTGVIGAISQSRISKILAYSSLLRGGWVLTRAPNFKLGLIFLTAYRIRLALCVISRFSYHERDYSPSSGNKNIFRQRLRLTIGLLSIAGLPPIVGFFAKVVLIITMVHTKMILALIILLALSPVILYTYTRFSLLIFKVKRIGIGIKTSNLLAPIFSTTLILTTFTIGVILIL